MSLLCRVSWLFSYLLFSCPVVSGSFNSFTNTKAWHAEIQRNCNSITLNTQESPFAPKLRNLFHNIIYEIFNDATGIENCTALEKINGQLSEINHIAASDQPITKQRSTLVLYVANLCFFLTKFRFTPMEFQLIEFDVEELLLSIQEFFIYVSDDTIFVDYSKVIQTESSQSMSLMYSFFKVYNKVEISNFNFGLSHLQCLVERLPTAMTSLSFLHCSFDSLVCHQDLSRFKNLLKFRIENCILKSGIFRIFKSIDPNVQHLRIANNESVVDQTIELVQILKNLPRLTTLSVSGSDFDVQKCNLIIASILELPLLESLDVSNTILGLHLLLKLKNSYISQLNLINSGITDAILSKNYKELFKLPKLTRLWISAGSMHQSLLKFSKDVTRFTSFETITIDGEVDKESLKYFLKEIDKKQITIIVDLLEFHKITLDFIRKQIFLRQICLIVEHNNGGIVSYTPEINKFDIRCVDEINCEFKPSHSFSKIRPFSQFLHLKRLTCSISNEHQLNILSLMFGNCKLYYLHLVLSKDAIPLKQLIDFLMRQDALLKLKISGQPTYDFLVFRFISQLIEREKKFQLEELCIDFPIRSRTLVQILEFSLLQPSLTSLSVGLDCDLWVLDDVVLSSPIHFLRKLKFNCESVDVKFYFPYPKKFMANFPWLTSYIVNGQSYSEALPMSIARHQTR